MPSSIPRSWPSCPTRSPSNRWTAAARPRTAPQRPHRIVGLGPALSTRRRRGRPLSPFVGRDRQLRLFDEALALAESGAGQLIGIVGEPGMGKSRLVEEVRRASVGRARWIEGRCSPYGGSRPYLPVLGLVRRLCAVPGRGLAEVERAVTGAYQRMRAPAGEAPYVLNLLGALDPLVEESLVAPLSPEAVRTRTFEALRHLFLAAAQDEPLVIAVEDLHWADDTSARFLSSLASGIAGARVLLLTTYRPGSRPGWLELSHATQIALPRLGPADSLKVVHSVLGDEAVSESLGRAILARGEGNPFFIEELSLAGPRGEDGEVPGRVEDVLMARIDRLADEPRSVLQTAAVLGRRFPLRLLAAVWPGAGVVQPSLDDLVREEFLVEAVVEGEGGFEFKHALTQDVAYQSIGAPNRRALHESAGLCLEELYAGRTEEVDDLLAHHWSRTGDAARAVAYLQRAAERSFRGYAHPEASAMLREALRHAERLPAGQRDRRVVELSLRLVDSMYFLGEMDESEEILTALAPRVTALPDADLACSFHFWAAHTASHLGKPDDCRARRPDLHSTSPSTSATARPWAARSTSGRARAGGRGGSRRACGRGRVPCRSSSAPGRPGGSATATSSSPIRSTRWAASTAPSTRPRAAGRSATPWRIRGCGAGPRGHRASTRRPAGTPSSGSPHASEGSSCRRTSRTPPGRSARWASPVASTAICPRPWPTCSARSRSPRPRSTRASCRASSGGCRRPAAGTATSPEPPRRRVDRATSAG